MRIVAGRLRGRTLRGPTRGGVRPTSDGLRETLFNVIGPRVEDARVLDAYAGTGAVGLEALSRGATSATFVERDRHAAAVIRQNIAACGVGESARLVEDDFFRTASRAEWVGAFDIVFLDPPYGIENGVEGPTFRSVGMERPTFRSARAGREGRPEGRPLHTDLERIAAAAARLVSPDGLLVLEHSRRRGSPEAAGALVRTRVLVAGDSALSFYVAPAAG